MRELLHFSNMALVILKALIKGFAVYKGSSRRGGFLFFSSYLSHFQLISGVTSFGGRTEMGSSVPQEHHKIIVLYARLNGISLAKIFLDFDSVVDIMIFDCESSVAGVWVEGEEISKPKHHITVHQA